MGYFLWLNERIDTTNGANEIVNINPSNTVTGTSGSHEASHADVATGRGALSPPFCSMRE